MTTSGWDEPQKIDRTSMGYQHSALQKWELKIHAFVETCDLSTDRPSISSEILRGVTVGIKDIIDVAGVPTRNGSHIFRSAEPSERDAAVVAALRNAGADIIGKTTTTEFAFTDPTDCRNPYDLNRSPGGSSSGSGAAVAAGLIDLALGTQTAGSLCRPAAYCGVVGFKPTFGWTSTEGVTPLAPSFDTVGIITRTIDMAERGFRVVAPDFATEAAKRPEQCIGASLLWGAQTEVASETLAAFHGAEAAFGEICGSLQGNVPDIDSASVVQDHRTVMNYEAALAHGYLLTADGGHLLKTKFKAGLQAGAVTPKSDADSAKQRLATARQAFWDSMAETDVILTLPVPDGAPLMDGTTGFQDWLTPWTVFGGPLISLPWGLDTLGRPKAVMLASRPGSDMTLLNMARTLESCAPELPPPTLPPD